MGGQCYNQVSPWWERRVAQEVIEMASDTTLTIRLPDALRQELDYETSLSNRSLNSVIVELIQAGLKTRESTHQKRLWERDMDAISKTGLVEPRGECWRGYVEAAREITHAQVREMLAGLSPLSEDIIAERNEGR
jgi:predicted transcriptional regulator